jgi:cyanate lyase
VVDEEEPVGIVPVLHFEQPRVVRERSNELWGDGILSAIDCKVTLEKKGERGVITIDAKFLHYKEF